MYLLPYPALYRFQSHISTVLRWHVQTSSLKGPLLSVLLRNQNSHANCSILASTDSYPIRPNACLYPCRHLRSRGQCHPQGTADTLLTVPLPFSVPCRHLQTKAHGFSLVSAGNYNQIPFALFYALQSPSLTWPLPPLLAHTLHPTVPMSLQSPALMGALEYTVLSRHQHSHTR